MKLRFRPLYVGIQLQSLAPGQFRQLREPVQQLLSVALRAKNDGGHKIINEQRLSVCWIIAKAATGNRGNRPFRFQYGQKIPFVLQAADGGQKHFRSQMGSQLMQQNEETEKPGFIFHRTDEDGLHRKISSGW